MEKLNDLYRSYGQAVIELKIAQAKLNEIEAILVSEINKQKHE